jgi:DNA-directed RNA polymerase specialized sigma subunit, sigma54 homolog
MEEQNKLVGKIILSNFLEYGVERFITFVNDVEESPLYKRLVEEGIIVPTLLPDVKVLRQKNAPVLAKAGVVAKIGKGVDFSIYYTMREFSMEYQLDKEKLRRSMNNLKLTEKKDISRLLNKLRRINTRNLLVHKILKGVVEHQRNYFESNNELDLKPLTRAELARLISDSEEGNHSFDFIIDASRMSRAMHGLSLITPKGKEVPLRLFFASRKDMVKRCVRAILNREKDDICSGQSTKPYTDEELSYKLNEEYGLLITRRGVTYCRRELGVLPYLERNGYEYRTLLANFSQIYPFTTLSVESNSPMSPGVYELRLDGDGIEYPTGCSPLFYIGSAKNLRKRLLSHLSLSSKNGGIKRFAEEKSCVFRYLQLPRRWTQEEKRLYNLFISTYGDSPLYNHISPKGASI